MRGCVCVRLTTHYQPHLRETWYETMARLMMAVLSERFVHNWCHIISWLPLLASSGLASTSQLIIHLSCRRLTTSISPPAPPLDKGNTILLYPFIFIYLHYSRRWKRERNITIRWLTFPLTCYCLSYLCIQRWEIFLPVLCTSWKIGVNI